MIESTTMILRLSSLAKRQLAELAERTNRIQSFLAVNAITEYVERELAAVEESDSLNAELRNQQNYNCDS